MLVQLLTWLQFLTDFISDSSPPQLSSLILTLILILVFDKPIDVDTPNFSEITIQSGSARYTLTNGSVIDMIGDDQVTLQVMLTLWC